jgi:serine protease AprX
MTNGETNEAVEAARRQVRDRYGAKLEAKASDAMVLRLAAREGDSPMASFGIAAEEPSATILELHRDREIHEEVRQAEETLRAEPGVEAFRASLDRLEELPGRGDALLRDLVRRRKIAEARSAFLQASAPVRRRLEEAAARQPWLGGGAADEPATGVCWLNRSIRAPDLVDALAEVADADEVERFDLPRRLTAEIDATGPLVGAAALAAGGVDGGGILVGVLDSEVAGDHPALQGRVVRRENYTREPWGTPSAHGTAVAGIIASADASRRGMAPGVTIYNYKVLASRRDLNAEDFGGALALQQALEDGVQIANCSWGAGRAGDGTSREARACDNAWALGMAIVKSAGNEGPGAATLTTPADAEGVIVVGASDRGGQAVQSYSSRGPTADGRARPHLVAPGGDWSPRRGILSCRIDGTFADAGIGTSLAAPHVSGLLALLLAADPDLCPDELRETLFARCRQLAEGDENIQGLGFLSFA